VFLYECQKQLTLGGGGKRKGEDVKTNKKEKRKGTMEKCSGTLRLLGIGGEKPEIGSGSYLMGSICSNLRGKRR